MDEGEELVKLILEGNSQYLMDVVSSNALGWWHKLADCDHDGSLMKSWLWICPMNWLPRLYVMH